MSVIGKDHTFTAFVSGKSTAFEGQRLSQISFKTTKEGTKRDSVCVSIPPVALSNEEVLRMKNHVVALVEKTQDAIIREMVIAGKTSVNDEQITFNECLAYLDAESEGTRLTKEDVVTWFNGALADKLRIVFADKMGLSDTPSESETKVLEQKVNQYRECYAALAGGKKMYEKPVATMLYKTLEKYAEEEDSIAGKFVARLEKMANAEVPSLGDVL